MKIVYQTDFKTRVRKCFPADSRIISTLESGEEEFGKVLAGRLGDFGRNELLSAVSKLDTETIRTIGDQYREACALLAEWIETYKPVGYKIPIFA
jgi:hypothetical protein